MKELQRNLARVAPACFTMDAGGAPMAGQVDVREHNRDAWDQQVAAGNRWTIPATPRQVAEARAGRWQVLLTPGRPVPAEWFLAMPGCRILCLACGGGQQGPIFAAAGAQVTVLDNSPQQLERDRDVASRHGLTIRTVLGDMADLRAFADESFDLVFHPVSNVFAPEVRPIWREVARVLRNGGALLAGFNNPAMYIFDPQAAQRGELVAKYSLPYSDLHDLDREQFADLLRNKTPLEFSHTLEEQIGGQCDAGLAIIGMYEDHDTAASAHPLERYMPLYIATRAVKYVGTPARPFVAERCVEKAIDRDLPCVRCGYNLRTLGTEGKCPECGAGVTLTLELGGTLQRTRPGYLGRLAGACWLLFTARFAAALLVLVAVRLEALELLLPGLTLGGAVYAIGALLLTGREHPRLRPEMPLLHAALRVCSIAILIGAGIVLMVALTLMFSMSWGSFMIRPGTRWLGLGMWFVYCLCPMLEMPLLVRLSRRVSDGSLREHAIIAGIGATVSGLLFVGVAASYGLGVRRIWVGTVSSMYVVLGLLIALLLFWIWTGYASLLTAMHLSRAWAAADARWQRHAPAQA